MFRFLIILAAALSVANAWAQDGNFLNVAIMELPARYFADIPRDQRALFLLSLSEQPGDRRLDYQHGWLHWYSDSEGPPHGTSMLYLKLLPRKDNTPLVLTHMPKPFADGHTPARNQTFVLERDGSEWRDVTKRVIPKQADLTMHFSPRRASNVVEVAAYERFKRRDGRGYSYTFSHRTLDLIWDGATFRPRTPPTKKLSVDDI
jgi:hypothetical protein